MSFNPQELYLERCGNARECRIIHFHKPYNKIGRSYNMDFYFNTNMANTVSREQAVIEFKNGKMYINNLSKTNPTFLNDDKVIRPTEVEEGDVVGFGSKPNVPYPNFREEQIFIYKCKKGTNSNNMKQEETSVIELVEISDDDDDDVAVILSNEESPPPLPTKLEAIAKVEPQAEPSRVQINITDVKPNEVVDNVSTLEMEKPNTSAFFDKMEKLQNQRNSDSDSHSPEPEPFSGDSMIRVSVTLKKLTNSDFKKWLSKRPNDKKPKKKKESSSDDDADDDDDKPLATRKYDSERLRRIVDSDTEDEEHQNIPITPSKSTNENESAKNVKQAVKRENGNAKPKADKKRACLPEERDMNAVKKKRKLSHEATSHKKQKVKFLDDAPSTSRGHKKPTTGEKKSSLKDRRTSMSELRHETVRNEARKPSDILTKRRMSMLPVFVKSSSPMRTKPTVAKKLTPKRRQTTYAEPRLFDMFDKATLLKEEKYGNKKPDGVNGTAAKDAPGKSTSENGIKSKDHPVVSKNPEKLTEKEAELSKHAADSSRGSDGEKNTSSGNENSNDNKKLSRPKVKVTQNTRGNYLTEEFLKEPKRPPARRMSSFNEPPPQLPSTSKESFSISSFREKYVKTDAPHSLSHSTNNNNTSKGEKWDKVDNSEGSQNDDFLENCVSAKINMEIMKAHGGTPHERPSNNNDLYNPFELDSQSDDEEKEKDNPIGFYTSINETPEKLDVGPTDSLETSPMKDDPRGKTKWSKARETEVQKPEERIENDIYSDLHRTIYVHHDTKPKNLKHILKTTIDFHSSTTLTTKKRVSFNYNLAEYRIIPANERPSPPQPVAAPTTPINQQVAHVQPIMQPIGTIHPRRYESKVCAEILEWNTDWLHLTQNSLPTGWELKKIETVYSSFKEYKSALKAILNVDLLKKMAAKYNSSYIRDQQWTFVTVKERKDEPANDGHLKLVLSNEHKENSQGYLLMLKVRNHSSGSNDDKYFFGYIMAVYDKGEIKVDSYCKDLPKQMAVIKSKSVMYLRNDLKLLALISCLQEKPLMKLFLDPNLNQINRNDETYLNIPLYTDIDSRYNTQLNPDRRIVKKLIYELSHDAERIFFINGSAGVGKTYMMILAICNMFYQSMNIACNMNTPKKRFLVLTPTVTGIDEITEKFSCLKFVEHANVIRIGYREKMSGLAKKLDIDEQVKHRLHNGSRENEQMIRKEIIESADIILSTVRGCYDLFDFNLRFDTCFIDEANYCIDSELMIPMHLSIQKLVLLGDEFQLLPNQFYTLRNSRDLNFSYFNRMVKYYKNINYTNAPFYTMTRQQRMNPELLQITNKYIYNDILTHNPFTIPCDFAYKSFMVFSVNEPKDDYKLHEDYVSYFTRKLCEVLPKSCSIGILSAFTNKQRICRDDEGVDELQIELAQGFEKDVIILQIPEGREASYCLQFNRINVALTRARKAFYLVLNSAILYHNQAGLYKKLKDEAYSRGCFESIYKVDRDKLGRMLRK